MTENVLKRKRVAIIATNGVDSIELQEVRRVLVQHGAQTTLFGIKTGDITTTKSGEHVSIDDQIENAHQEDFDALFLPGGLLNSDKLRTNEKVISFIQQMGEAKKFVSAICHGPWLLINAKLVKGKKVTSYPSVQVDLENAGAEWVNEQVVVDGNIITSRQPDDATAFGKTLVSILSQ